jgi:hypothetical protein
MSTDPSIWIAAILTLAIFSFVYRENPVYRFAEHLFVGVSAGFYLVQYFFSAIVKKLYTPVFVNHDYALIVGGILGFMMFTRLFRRVDWVSRFPIAFYVAAWAGYLIPSVLQARVLLQLQGTMLTPDKFTTVASAIASVLIFVGVLSILIYFYFSAVPKGPLKGVSKIGITFLMLGFGASFGYTVMGRITLLIGRMQFLLADWLGIIAM